MFVIVYLNSDNNIAGLMNDNLYEDIMDAIWHKHQMEKQYPEMKLEVCELKR